MTATVINFNNHGQHVRFRQYLAGKDWQCLKAPPQEQTEPMRRLAARLGLDEIRSHSWLVADDNSQRCVHCGETRAKRVEGGIW